MFSFLIFLSFWVLVGRYRASECFPVIPGSANLTGRRFPFTLPREFACKRLICPAISSAKTALTGQNQRNSRFYGNKPPPFPPRKRGRVREGARLFRCG